MSTTIEHPVSRFAPRSSCCPRCDAMAVENARLRHELRDRTDKLNGSRARILQARDAERRQLERNLHDGAQQRLVALSLTLRTLAAQLTPCPDTERLLDAAREELQSSLNELRELARGLHPAVLCDYGLAVALQSLAARAPIPVELTVDLDRRADTCVEVAAYYIVAEALTNVAKYARATTATVTVARSHETVLVQISDDGIGGADPLAGSGLRGVADRVEALGGVVSVSSPIGKGTSIAATIPCSPVAGDDQPRGAHDWPAAAAA